MGQYMVYGLCENYQTALRENLLPIGLVEGCGLKRDINQDEVIAYDDVELPAGRLADRIRKEQTELFPISGS